MIKYRLSCRHDHEFEGWFRDSEAFDEQAALGRLSCPVCGTDEVAKAIMAPSVSKGGVGGRNPTTPERQREIVTALRRLRDEVEARSTYVGERFAEEARKIHFGESAPRTVHGEATSDEVNALTDDGVPVLPLPRLPKELN